MNTRIEKIPIRTIHVRSDRRPIILEKVRTLAKSIAEIGLKTPITVRRNKKGRLILVVGHHRLGAAKSLKWKSIKCFVIDGSKTDAQLWTMAENLHRAELTALQRAESLEKWESLMKERAKAVQNAQHRGHQPHDKGISQTARELGTTREDVRRTRKVGNISLEAKTAAKNAGLGDNTAALLKVAKERSPKAQVKKVHELAQRKRTRELSRSDRRQLRRLKGSFEAAREFKRAWTDASAMVRQKFIKGVLRSGGE